MRKSSRSRAKPRTLKTYQNKQNKLKSYYNKIYKHSLKSKEKYNFLPEEKRPKNIKFFCDKYPTFEEFQKVNKLKEVGKEREIKSTTTYKPRTNLRVWGR